MAGFGARTVTLRARLLAGCLGMLASTHAGGGARAADVSPAPAKAPDAASNDGWSGLYLGSHYGYATGRSDWTVVPSPGGGAPVGGALDLFNSYNSFKGTGSDFLGLQAGYNLVLGSGWMLGAEADLSAPSAILGTQILASPSLGLVTYGDTVELFGTTRARLGYAMGRWLPYVTGGFAWSYDQSSPAGLTGLALAGTTAERALFWRLGWAAGAGLEFAIAPHWSARFEYLFTDFGKVTTTFPVAGEQITSDLTQHELRAGLNYKLGDPASWKDGVSEFTAPAGDFWSIHGQTTYVNQYAAPFRAPYSGTNSLSPNQGRETSDATLYAGFRLWQGAELWVNPEIDQGFGLDGSVGAAGFPSGEAYKVGADYPYARVPRAFIRQTINLGGETEKLESAANQFAGTQTADRVVLTLGKFAVTDVFDTNKYAHDPRSDFLNWSVIDTGTFDYAADAWGYTYGAAAEWYQGPWTLRAGIFDLSNIPNSTDLDPTLTQFQWVGEIERRYDLWGQPGKVAVTGFLTRGRMGAFADALQLAQATGGPADIAAVRQYASRGGVSMNLEQQLTPDLGVFARAGWADGNREPFEFTDIDRTAAVGLSVAGSKWGRSDDTFGLVGVVNGISAVHQAYFNAGGLGILVGDGTLPHYAPEQIIETYYSFPLSFFRVTADYQFIANPAYNQDRGPVSVFTGRLHAQF